jgi:hypothetical protein
VCLLLEISNSNKIILFGAHFSCFQCAVTGDVVSYGCQSGFALIGAVARTCLATGAWSGAAPVCSGRSCVIPFKHCRLRWCVCVDVYFVMFFAAQRVDCLSGLCSEQLPNAHGSLARLSVKHGRRVRWQRQLCLRRRLFAARTAAAHVPDERHLDWLCSVVQRQFVLHADCAGVWLAVCNDRRHWRFCASVMRLWLHPLRFAAFASVSA